jgi:hypothetical protein
MRKHYDFSEARRGAVLSSTGKTRITIMLDDDVLSHFRRRGEQLGVGYQTLVNDALRQSLSGKKTASRSCDGSFARNSRRLEDFTGEGVDGPYPTNPF